MLITIFCFFHNLLENCRDFFKFRFLLLFILFVLGFNAKATAQFIKPLNPNIQTSGDVIVYALPASALATTLIVGDTKGTWQFAKGFLTNQAVTYVIKSVINKKRPYHHGDHAFPSGHTSTSFQAASFIHARYGFKYSIPAYILAGWTAYSRLNAQKHDGYDILGGVVVGVGSTLLFTTRYEKEHMQLTFSSSDDSYLLGFTYRF